MNKTKYALILTAIILNFGYVALNLYYVVRYFMSAGIAGADWFFLIYDFIGVGGFLVNIGLLSYSIAGRGKHFRARYNFYMAAVVISFFIDLFSLSTILLVISMFLSDWVWIKPQDDVYFSEEDVNAKPEVEQTSEHEKAKKIARLRELKEKGLLTEEEFKEELMKLL